MGVRIADTTKGNQQNQLLTPTDLREVRSMRFMRLCSRGGGAADAWGARARARVCAAVCVRARRVSRRARPQALCRAATVRAPVDASAVEASASDGAISIVRPVSVFLDTLFSRVNKKFNLKVCGVLMLAETIHIPHKFKNGKIYLWPNK